jgi:hypothetical protein
MWNDPWHRRHRIADWLVLTRSLVGKTRAEIVAQLGGPSPTEHYDEWSLVYNLGPERGLISMDNELLVVRLNPEGIASEATITYN